MLQNFQVSGTRTVDIRSPAGLKAAGTRPRVAIMIESGEQYRTTLAWMDRLRTSIERLRAETPAPGVHARLHQALIDAEISRFQDLVDDVADYEERRRDAVHA
jgi:hypothetical protein